MVLLAVTCYIEELQEKNQVKAVSLGSALLLSKECNFFSITLPNIGLIPISCQARHHIYVCQVNLTMKMW